MVLIFTNDNAIANHTIYPVGGPWWVFNRMRILAGVQVIEDTDSHNRDFDMLQECSKTDSRAHS